MKLNKKGMTLVELIISMALISIVLTFMYRLILDVNYEKNNTGFASDNQINRAEIIRTIEEDFIANELINVVKNNNEITFTYAKGENKNKKVSITADGKKLTYGNKVWEIEDPNYYYAFGETSYNSSDKNYYIRIIIEVKNDAAEVNTVDDINLFYIGTKN